MKEEGVRTILSAEEKEFEENKNWQRKVALKTDFNVLG